MGGGKDRINGGKVIFQSAVVYADMNQEPRLYWHQEENKSGSHTNTYQQVPEKFKWFWCR